MKILLVETPLSHLTKYVPFSFGPAFPLGLLSIGSYISKHGFEDVGLENYHNCDWYTIESQLRMVAPDVIGISCTTDARGWCWKYAELAKKINPNVVIVFGNVHATFYPTQMIEYHHVDFCVLYEGEVTMLELLRALESGRTEFSDILGLVWRDESGKIICNEARPWIQDLDSIPISRKRRMFVNPLGEVQGNLLTSRGCPFSCGFCSSPSFWKRSWRTYSVERVVEEFEVLVTLGAQFIDVLDDLFTMDIPRAVKICDALIAKNNRVPFMVRARINCISEDLVDKLIEAGCRDISFGIESGDPEMIKRINKKIDLGEAVKVFDMLARKNITSGANFMVGNPGETLASVEATTQLACRLNPDKITTSVASVYPHTQLDKLAQAHGLISETFWYKSDEKVPRYTVDMPEDQLKSLALRLFVRAAISKGFLKLARLTLRNLKSLGFRKGFDYVRGWVLNKIRQKALGSKPTAIVSTTTEVDHGNTDI